MMSPTSLSPLQTEPGDAPRHLRVREAITRAIRAREFAPDSRLPGERDLAEQFGVSYATVRRAIAEMVEADLLERRPNKGTFVCAHGSRRLTAVTVNLIYPLQQSSFGTQFLQSAIARSERRGWHHHLVHLQSGRERASVRALQSGESAILLAPAFGLDAQIQSALENAQGCAVLIGSQITGTQVPSIMGDDAQAVSLMLECLQHAGHRAIGFISKNPQHPIEQTRIAVWKSYCAAEATSAELERRLIAVELNGIQSDASHSERIYGAVRTYLESPACDVTALICAGDTATVGTMAACRDAGRPVPQKMSVIAAGDSSFMRFYNPPVTCVDVPVRSHVERALSIIEAALNGSPPAAMSHLIEPVLIERASVTAPFAMKSPNL